MKEVPLSSGVHVIDWVYDKVKDNMQLTPIQIQQIRIEGGSAGSSDTCNTCPRVHLIHIFS